MSRSALGPLVAVLTDAVTDVLVNGAGRVWVDDPSGLRRVRVDGLDTEPQVRALAMRIAAAGGRRLDDASPWVDLRLPDGTRAHVVLPALSPAGTHISLRLPARRGLGLDELTALGAVSPALAAGLRDLVRARVGLLVVGPTGAGKTTVLSALLGLVGADERIVCVEDASELRPAHPHVVSLESRPGNVEGAGAVGMDVLVRQALRMRPDRLVVGECRGAEVRELLLALGAGHCGASTLHAAGAEDVPTRVVALGGVAGISPAVVAEQLRVGVAAVVPVVRGRSGLRRVAGVWTWADPPGRPGPGGYRLACALDADGRPGTGRMPTVLDESLSTLPVPAAPSLPVAPRPPLSPDRGRS